MKKILYLVPILPILIWLPFLLATTMPLGHDLYAHLTYAKLFERALNDGQFPVRWMEWIKPGFSQPLFNFYQVGFYYLASLVNWLPVSFITATKLSILFLWGFGSFFVYMFTKKFGPLPAVAATVAYALSPYLIIDIFVRNAFPEFMAISLMPAVFWSVDRLISTAKAIYIIPFALFLGTAVFSHLPATVIFLPVLAGYSLLLLSSRQRLKKKLFLLSMAVILGFGLAAFYLMPAISELNLVQINKIRSSNFDFHKHFVDMGQSFTEGLANPLQYSTFHFQLQSIWIIVVLVFIAGFTLWIRNKSDRALLFWMVILIYPLFFSTSDSVAVWEKIRFLGFFQFPWRFFMITPLAFAILTAFLFQVIKGQIRRPAGLLAVVLLGFASSLFYLKPVKFTDVAYFDLPYSSWIVYSKTQQRAYLEPAYYPKEVKTTPKSNISLWSPQAGVSISEKKIAANQLVLEVSSLKQTFLVVNTHYFPGWEAIINGKDAPIYSTKETNFIKVSVPDGKSQIELKFTDTKLRRWANVISLISFILIVLAFWLDKLLMGRTYFFKLFDYIPSVLKFSDINRFIKANL